MAEDVDAPALLEWLGSVDSASRQCRSIEELGDGTALLRVMHDLSPETFPSPEGRWGTTRDRCLLQLLTGLEEHLRGRGESDRTCELLLGHAKVGQPVDAALLTKLVLVATVENDLPQRRFYVEAMMHLSRQTQETVQEILQRFLSGAGLESPTMSSPMQLLRPHATPFHTEPSFTPPARHRSETILPDFREAGLDVETRFRRLQEHYNASLDAQERLQEEKASLRRDLEVEQARRKEAEQLERSMRLDLREAEEARDRAREEQRMVFEKLLETEVGKIREKVANKDEDLEVMREELELKRSQAAAAEKLSNQLELFKQKVEELQAFRHENDELKEQIAQLLDKGDHAAGEHLHRSLTRARDHASKAAMERDEALRQSELLREELSREQELLRKHRGEIEPLRRGSSFAAAYVPPEVVVAPCNAARGGLALEASAAILASAASDGELQPEPPRRSSSAADGPSLEELRLVRTQKDEMMERLLVQQERATKAETSAQLKNAEVEVLGEQKSSLMKQVAKLEVQLDELRSRATAEATPAGGQAHAAEAAAEGSERIQELHSKLALRERELQVHQYREKTENASLTAQESLMASCFHELGLRYQRLKADHDRLQRRLRNEPPGG